VAVKAFVIDRYGGPEVLHAVERPRPELGPGDVLVEVHAASVNPIDWKIRDGKLKSAFKYDFPLTLGQDLSGVVMERGAQARRFEVGDAVFARLRKGRIGSFAELCSVDESDLAKKPSKLGHVEAASLPLVGLTAWQALIDIAEVRAGQNVFIQAGAGGVGTFAIQLAKHLGATVATTASPANHEFLKSLGADVLIDYRTQDFADVLRDQDLVLDTLGGDALKKSFDITKPGGVVVSIAGVPDPQFARDWELAGPVRVAIALISFPTRRRARARGVRYHFHMMRESGEQLGKIAQLVDRGVIRPRVDREFPFEETPAAVAHAEQGRASGKVVVRVRE
jgi:alcohol dehydrogenase